MGQKREGGSVSGLKCRPDNIFLLVDLFAFCFVLFFTFFSVFLSFFVFHVSISFWLFSLSLKLSISPCLFLSLERFSRLLP